MRSNLTLQACKPTACRTWRCGLGSPTCLLARLPSCPCAHARAQTCGHARKHRHEHACPPARPPARRPNHHPSNWGSCEAGSLLAVDARICLDCEQVYLLCDANAVQRSLRCACSGRETPWRGYRGCGPCSLALVTGVEGRLVGCARGSCIAALLD